LKGELDSAGLSVVWLSEQQSNICNIWHARAHTHTHTHTIHTHTHIYTHTHKPLTQLPLCVVNSRPAFKTVNTKNTELSVADVDQNIVVLS